MNGRFEEVTVQSDRLQIFKHLWFSHFKRQ